MAKRPLEGYRVLDFTQAAAGPMAVAQLADFGAEIIKVERPPKGDDTRYTPPSFSGTAGYYLSMNRGKKSILLDFNKPKAKEIALQLAAVSDIVYENYRPGVMSKLGLGYEEIKKVKPDIIYVSASGFGQSGPYTTRAAYDLVVQSMGGLMSVTGPKGGEWTKGGTSIADLTCGVFGALGTLLAVVNRQNTGEGCYMDVSMLDTTMALMENHIANYLNAGIIPRPMGTRNPYVALYDRLPTSDGEIVCCAATNPQFTKFCLLLGLPDLQKESRFATPSLRRENEVELLKIIETETKKFKSKQIVEMSLKQGLPVSEINTVEKAVEDEHIKSRGMIVDVVDRVAGKFKIIGSPIKSTAFEMPRSSFSSQLGEYTVEVLRDVLGMGDKEIEEALKEI